MSASNRTLFNQAGLSSASCAAFWCGLLLTSSLTVRAGPAPATGLLASPTVDWYNPPPKEYRERAPEILVPTELIGAVYTFRMDEATAILGSATIIEITKERATYLASVGDPSVTISEQLKKAKEKLELFVERRRRGHYDYPKNIREQLDASDDQIIEELKREITGYEGWGNNVTPYLIKAVVGGAGTFFGHIVDDRLFLSHVAVGAGPLEIERRPVVAYLPKKPQYVYHAVTGMQ